MHLSGPSLPFLDAINPLIAPDKDTNFLSNLINSQSVRANITMELTKALYERLDKDDLLFKSPKELEWSLEILGYGFIPPHYQYIKEDRNFLKFILNIYEYILCNEIETVSDGKIISRRVNSRPVLNEKNHSHQKIFLKMLSHLTLLFDKRNFEKKPNPLVGDPRIREEEMKVPIKLCAMVIKIFHKFLTKTYAHLYVEHWEYIIKLLLGLAQFVLQGNHDTRFPERINVAIVELVFNAWILSGLQGEEIWTVFKHRIHEMINKDIIVSYWTDICTELTSKLLIDFKCYDPPKLILTGDKEIVEYQENLLIINHHYNIRKTEIQTKNKFTLFIQPFLFRISQEQVQYLWGKMITMMNMLPTTVNHRISLLIMKGVRNVVHLILRLGACFKPKEETQQYSEAQQYNEYSIENKRKIIIEHDFSYFKNLLNLIVHNTQIVPNQKTIPTGQNAQNNQSSQASSPQNQAQPESDKSTLTIKKKTAEESLKLTKTNDIEHSWMVRTEKIPSGEALLKLFGKILFETASESRKEFEEVRLTSINILCQIFTKASGQFSETSVKKFYQVFLSFLEKISWKNFEILLKHSTELFLVNHLPHNIILQKPLITKLVQYYEEKKNNLVPDKILRRSCNKLCSSLLCFFNDEYGLINDIHHYDKNIKDVLYQLLNLAFQKDKHEFINHSHNPREEVRNLSRSSWNFMIFSILNFKISGFVRGLIDEWLQKDYPPLMNNLIVDTLLVLGEMCLMKLEECDIVSSMTEDMFGAGILVVKTVSKFIDMKMKDLTETSKQISLKGSEKDDSSKNKDKIIHFLSSCFGILYTWLLIIVHLKDFTSKEKDSFSDTFEQAIRLLVNHQNEEPFATSIKGIIAALFHRLGSLNFSKNISFTSSILLNDRKIKEKSLSEAINKLEEKCFLSIGIGEDTILSFYDVQIESANEVLLFVIRNSVGKFIWFGELFYKLHCSSKSEIKEEISATSETLNNEIQEEILKTRLLSYDNLASPSSGAAKQEFEILLQKQFDMEDQYEDSFRSNKHLQTKEIVSSEISENVPSTKNLDQTSMAKMNAIKMFLSNSGILNLKDFSKLTYIQSGENDQVLLEKIDSISTRCQILTSIFYVLKPSSEKIDEFPQFDKLFQKFIEEIGIAVDEEILELGAHESIRQYVNQHKKVLFASNPLYEIIFTLPNLTHRNLNETLTTPPIIIIWNAKILTPYDSFYPYIINHFDIKGYKAAIVITPLNESYFGISILKKDSEFMVFPPINDFVCSNHMLASVVLQVVISVYREQQFKQQQSSYHEAVLGKLLDRTIQISSFIRHQQQNVDSWELLKTFFEIPKGTPKQ